MLWLWQKRALAQILRQLQKQNQMRKNRSWFLRLKYRLHHSGIEFEKGKDCPSLKGRLKKNLIFWQKILSSNSENLEIIDKGYKIEFFKILKGTSFLNDQSVEKWRFCWRTHFRIAKIASIIEGEKPPEVINPLSVSIISSGKKRLILDLRYVNTHVYKDKIQFED